MDKVLVFGSNGFLGKAIVNLLKTKNYQVITSARQLNSDYPIDLNQPQHIISIITKIRPNVIVYTSAVAEWGSKVLQKMYAVNILAPSIIAKYCSDENIHLIHISGSLVYGIKTQLVNINSPFNTDTDYAKSKLLADRLVQASGAPYTIIRFGGIYGKNGPNHLFLNRNISSILKGESPILVGLGTTRRNYIYIKDAASAVLELIKKKQLGVYILSGPEILSIKEILKLLSKIANTNIKLIARLEEEVNHQIITSNISLPSFHSYEMAFEDILSNT